MSGGVIGISASSQASSTGSPYYTNTSGSVSVTSTGKVTGGSYGIEAFSIAGGFYSAASGPVNVTSTGTVSGGLGGILAFSSAYGTSGSVSVTSTGDVSGGVFGIEAFSRSYSGTSGQVSVTSAGNVSGGNYGIQVQSSGATAGNETVNVLSGTVIGGSAGVEFIDGATNTLNNSGAIANTAGIFGYAVLSFGGNTTINNAGTVTGDIGLFGGLNAFNNQLGGLFNSGSTVYLGAGNLLTNDGVLSPGGNATVLTTNLTGDFKQNGAGKFAVNLLGASSDLLQVTGGADLGGHVQPLFTLSGLGSTTQWQILTATTGAPPVVNDGIVVDNTAAVKFGLLFTPTEMDLVLLSVNFAAQGLNRNETSIAENLNGIYGAGGGSLVSLLDALAGLPTLGGLANALDQLSPEVYLDTEIATLFSQLAFTNALMSCPTREGANAFIKEGQCVWARVSGRDLNQEFDLPDAWL